MSLLSRRQWEDRQNSESNERLIGTSKMSTNFFPNNQKGFAALGEKDVKISAQCINFLTDMTAWRELWWHFFHCGSESVCLWVRWCLYARAGHFLFCYCRTTWSRQVFAPNLSHCYCHNILIPSSTFNSNTKVFDNYSLLILASFKQTHQTAIDSKIIFCGGFLSIRKLIKVLIYIIHVSQMPNFG